MPLRKCKKVKVSNDQEVENKKEILTLKTKAGKKPNCQPRTYTKRTYRKPSEQLFPSKATHLQ